LLAHLGLRHYFDFVIVSSVVGLAKPGHAIFDLVVDRVRRPRHRLLYVGDHVGDDIEGARGAGLSAALIDRGGTQTAAQCARIQSLEELTTFVRSPTVPAQAVVFDMDGVVLDSIPQHLRTWQQALAPLGIEVTADVHYPLEGVPTERTAQLLIEHYLGRACSEEEAQQLANAKRAFFRQTFEPRFIRGILPLIHDLRDRGYRLALVTGSAQSVVDESLAPTGVTDLFEVIVTGDQVTRGKPDPEPYRTAAARLGLAPAQCLVIENAPLGIQSAQSAGMTCVALETTLPASRLGDAELVFASSGELRSWLLAQWRSDGKGA
jgi:beta-phosphoglucomutase